MVLVPCNGCDLISPSAARVSADGEATDFPRGIQAPGQGYRAEQQQQRILGWVRVGRYYIYSEYYDVLPLSPEVPCSTCQHHEAVTVDRVLEEAANIVRR